MLAIRSPMLDKNDSSAMILTGSSPWRAALQCVLLVDLKGTASGACHMTQPVTGSLWSKDLEGSCPRFYLREYYIGNDGGGQS
jgi:hypothetical protein